ncbi:glycosyl transferase family 2 [Methylobacterium sp. 4-46]|uniref:glycosyltransferase n=1 Tax=unclassified Methylobacterium TaxID=2615210 RepID=UPI000165C65B|nr:MULTISPECIES: glycosyltransferase [Methylobacterium]ACA17712.1 glycosyl transferase family 2 [Methylobacterium sp. 4-46]WFT83381.1 glycosyltransferase [Methylobacterium nodulans]
MEAPITTPSNEKSIQLIAGSDVTVVITTYNHAHFLGEALASVAAQTRVPEEVIVVDDGSSDDPAAIVARWPGVRLIRQPNQGLSSARNTGLAQARTTYILFLDADDMLRPAAIAQGLAAFARSPGVAFVYGAHERVDRDGNPLGGAVYHAMAGDPVAALLHHNIVGMHATVLYRRDILSAAGGFDTRLRRCEDYDVYLRLAQAHAIASHPTVVARYRWHDSNMSYDFRAMRDAALAVHARYRPAAEADSLRRETWSEGRRFWRRYYAGEALRAGGRISPRGVAAAARLDPLWTAGELARRAAIRLGGAVSRRAGYRLRRRLVGRASPPVGRVDWGDFGTPWPVSEDFGWDRGLPVDRFYIERFLEGAAADIRGRVLEIGDDAYSRRFGGARVERQDILHVEAGNPRATLIGDISRAGTLPQAAFDCIVLTQTLHLIFDMASALRQLHGALRPGGVLLLTVPGISPIDRGEWSGTWFWSLTPAALTRLLDEVFGAGAATVRSHGNVYAATAFLQGLALSEVDPTKLDVADASYPVIVAARAARRP